MIKVLRINMKLKKAVVHGFVYKLNKLTMRDIQSLKRKSTVNLYKYFQHFAYDVVLIPVLKNKPT